MIITLDYDKDFLKKVSGNYIKDLDCFEVEIIKNEKGSDTLYRIEFIDNDYINVTNRELAILKRLLSNPTVSKKLNLDRVL